MQFDLQKTNIFMKIILLPNKSNSDLVDLFNNKEKVMFIYSNINGINYLEKQLKESILFKNLWNAEEVINKMIINISHSISQNKINGINSSHWIGNKLVLFTDEQEQFKTQFNNWKEQLSLLIGSDNLFEVTIPMKEMEQYMASINYIHLTSDEQDEALLNYIEKHRLNLFLQHNLLHHHNSNKNKL